MRRRCRWVGPGEVHEIAVRLARETLDVSGVAKRVFLFSGGVTTQTIKSEARIRNGERGIVVIHALRAPKLAPVPAILRTLRVFDHDGPTSGCRRRFELVLRSRRRILF